jgi:hypothetical protein
MFRRITVSPTPAAIARIERVDLATVGGLRDRAGERLQGAVREHGFRSSPTPDTHVHHAPPTSPRERTGTVV